MTKAPVRKSLKAGLATGLTMAPTIAAPVGAVTDNIREKKTVDMNFKVSGDFHSEFKATAAIRGMKMKDLLEECFATWKRSNQ